MSAPSDLELMMFHDGELEEPRRSEVAAWLEQSTSARGKLAGLSLAGEIVRESALATAQSFDITDALMRRIGPDKPSAEGAKVIELKPKQEKADKQPERSDGGRLLLPLTALAAAAAAALFIWGRSGPTDVPVAKTQATETAEPVQPLPTSKTAAAPSPSTELFAKADEDPEPSVQVASVDFGSRTGAVYYVGGASQGATTTVVWVTEE